MNNPVQDLTELLIKIKIKLDQSEHFSQYSWKSKEEALKEIDEFINDLKNNILIDKSRFEYLFAPTCKLQETSIDNGWGDEFLQIAKQIDKILSMY